MIPLPLLLALPAALPAAARLQLPDDLAGRVQARVAPWDRDDSPGGVVGVLVGGEPALVLPFGMAELGPGAPRANAAETPFYLASVAKQFTAAAVACAARDGALDLDAPVTQVVPGLPESWGAISLRQLVHHRSGLRDVYELVLALDLGREPLRSNGVAIGLLAEVEGLNFPPGREMLYSNSGYVLLAEALRRATGEDLAAYAREHLFEPAGMRGARFGGSFPEGAAVSYGRAAGGWSPRTIDTGMVGPGGMLASFDDLAAWVRAQGVGAEGTWGDAPLRARLVTPPALAPGQREHPRFARYAYGLMVTRFADRPVVRHGGGAFGYSAEVLRFPDQGLAVIALSNAADLDAIGLAEDVARAALGDAPAGEPRSAGAAASADVDVDWAPFGRMWAEHDTGRVWVVTPKGAQGVVASLGDVKVAVAPVSAARLEALDAAVPLAFEVLEGEGGRSLAIRHHDGSTTLCRPLPFPPAPVDLVPWAGEYESVDNGARITLAATKRGLRLVQHDPLLELPPFQSLGPDTLVCDRGAQIDLRRDDARRPIGLVLSTNRAWGLEFIRR